MSIDRFVSRNWFACLLVALHALLLGAVAWIELDDTWNDQNPTFLVLLAAYYGESPVRWVIDSWIDPNEQKGTYLAALLFFGSVFWFLVGTVVTVACRFAGRSLAAPTSHGNGQ